MAEGKMSKQKKAPVKGLFKNQLTGGCQISYLGIAKSQDADSLSHNPPRLATASPKRCEYDDPDLWLIFKKANLSCRSNRTIPRTVRRLYWNHMRRAPRVRMVVTMLERAVGITEIKRRAI